MLVLLQVNTSIHGKIFQDLQLVILQRKRKDHCLKFFFLTSTANLNNIPWES